MADDLVALIRTVPAEAFQEPRNQLAGLTPLERIRWLQQTAWFVWKHKGAAAGVEGARQSDPPRS